MPQTRTEALSILGLLLELLRVSRGVVWALDRSFLARNKQEREVSPRPLLFQDFTIDHGVLDDLNLNNLVATF